ncbi:hypothetical protein D918_02533 [Trichuris suis]|nr:hypothetical protein D918_02533 [Trichuris suis]
MAFIAGIMNVNGQGSSESARTGYQRCFQKSVRLLQISENFLAIAQKAKDLSGRLQDTLPSFHDFNRYLSNLVEYLNGREEPLSQLIHDISKVQRMLGLFQKDTELLSEALTVTLAEPLFSDQKLFMAHMKHLTTVYHGVYKCCIGMKVKRPSGTKHTKRIRVSSNVRTLQHKLILKNFKNKGKLDVERSSKCPLFFNKALDDLSNCEKQLEHKFVQRLLAAMQLQRSVEFTLASQKTAVIEDATKSSAMNASIICEERMDDNSILRESLLALTSTDEMDKILANSLLTENQAVQPATPAEVKYFQHACTAKPSVIINNCRSAADTTSFEFGNKATLNLVRSDVGSADVSKIKLNADSFLSAPTPSAFQNSQSTKRTSDIATKKALGERSTTVTSQNRGYGGNSMSKFAHCQSKVRTCNAQRGKLRCWDSRNIAPNPCNTKVEPNGKKIFATQRDDHAAAHALVSQDSKTANLASRIPRHVYFLRWNAKGLYSRYANVPAEALLQKRVK